jgi:hypothetical protein
MGIINTIGFAKRPFITLLIMLPVMMTEGQMVSVKSFISSDSMMIGEQLQYTLRVDADNEVEIILPGIKDTLSHTLEVLALLSSDTTLSDNRIEVKQSYLITGFEPGPQIIPSQEVIYKRGGVTDTARSMPLILNVYEPVVDTSQQIKPIKPPINTPVTFREILPWAGIGLGGLVIALLIVWLLQKFLKRKGEPEGDSAAPLEPAHVIAFRELDKLKNENIWTKGEVKEYYTRLTEITRHYIERQYDIPAMESTTEEILDTFRRSNTEDSLLDEILKDLLELADLVKFAKEEPLPIDNQTNLNNAYLFVQKTYPLFYREETLRKDPASQVEERMNERREDGDG